MSESRTVQAAAIMGDDGKVYSEPRPARHHDVIAAMRMKGYSGSVAGIRQGFLLSDGRFATRDAARIIAGDASAEGSADGGQRSSCEDAACGPGHPV